MTTAPHIDLPTDRRRLRRQAYTEGCRSLVLPHELTASLESLSEQEHAGLFVTLLAAFTVLLGRYSRQEDIAVIDLSHFSSLAVRADLSGNPTFREVLRRVQHTRFTGCGHCDVRSAEPTSSSVYQVIFAIHESSNQTWDAAATSLDRFGLKPEAVGFELGLFVWWDGNSLRGVIKYNANLFDALTIERLSRHYQTLLQTVGGNPDQPIGTLPLITPAERDQLVQWNNTKSEYPRNTCVHRLFEARAQNTPDALAVAFEGQQLTYRELNSRANRIAHCLRKLGIGPEALVGLCVERSPEMYIGILASLKAGCAYVPLDPNYPDERLSMIMSDARPAVLLTKRHLRCPVPERDCSVIFLDEELASTGSEEMGDLAIAMPSDHLAYVIFTSGSTGKPKGVLISHRSLVNHSTAMARYYGLESGDRVLQFASVSFDVAAEEIFPTWLSGAAVVPWPAAYGMAPMRSFLEFVEKEKITVLNLPAPYWHEWVSELEEVGVPARVRLVVVGSDKVSAEKFSIWKKQIGDRVRLCNAYGPTEATITATVFEASGDFECSQTDCVPIGKPIDNTEAYVLDRNLNLVPIRVPGELHIGGVGLARGYLNRPELTAESFIANPFCNEAGGRLYKTGDLARYSLDGNLEYLGRLDNQVKLRGFRIELGEIESVIRQHEAVQDAIVIVSEDAPGDQRLVAYIIQAQEKARPTAELRTYLQQKLPEYMVPSALVAIDSFPLTPSGKVDRRALPTPNLSNAESEICFVAPRNDLERQLATLWEKLFALRPIGVHDDFFALGGNSLLALRLTSRIEKQLGRNLPVAALYQAPTVEQLAKLITHDAPSNWSSLIPLQPHGSKPPFFWIHGENSNAFLPRHLGSDQPIYGFKHQGEDGQPASYTTVEKIAAYYLSEILTVQAHGPYFLGGYCFGGMVAFEIAQQLQKQAEEVALIVFLAPDIPKTASVAVKANGESTSRASLSGQLHRYTHTLKALETRQKMSYVIGGVKGKVKERILQPAKKIAIQPASRLIFGLGYPLPLALRSPYILDLYDRAASEYAPGLQAGRIIVFKPTDDCVSAQGWESFAADGLEVHEVPGNHHDVVNKETHVALWAKQLRICLESAYSAASRQRTLRFRDPPNIGAAK
jgi:amino acid adenylation domain-containing protein